ncbi:cysteine desulfurase [Biomphalaria glabrata]|nr:cysteine desulfurase [Biomphalaria glabrata]
MSESRHVSADASYKSVPDIERKYDQVYDAESRTSRTKEESSSAKLVSEPSKSLSKEQTPLSRENEDSTVMDPFDTTSIFSDTSDILKRLINPEELDEKAKNELCSYIFRNIVGTDFVFKGPYGKNIVTYLDYTASGRPLKCFETYIRYHVMPTYANTHTEVNYNAAQTTKFREEARNIIRLSVKASKDDAVIFCGSGSTTAIHKVIHAMGLKRSMTSMLGPTVFVGPYEHHSNILPWIELKANVIRIKQTSHGLIDLEHLEQELKKKRCGSERLLIGSFSAASNVTGILTDTVAVSILMHQYNGYAFFDFACAAPYVDIDMNCKDRGDLAYKDAIFISPHKFIGGPQTPGLLVAKSWIFKNTYPHGVGGGTVVFVRRQNHVYFSEPEHKEEGGTPAIIESIRAGLVFKLKDAFKPKFIMEKEMQMMELAKALWVEHPNILILGNLNVDRLPIFSMLFLNRLTGRLLHHDFVAMLLNDLFGIQVRSGCACAAPYGLDLIGMTEDMAKRFENFITKTPEEYRSQEFKALEKEEESRKDQSLKEQKHAGPHVPACASHTKADNIVFRPGFVRLSFPFFLSQSCFSFVIKAILLVADKGWLLLPLYDFNRKTGKWWFRNDQHMAPSKSLKDVSFLRGRFDILEPEDDLSAGKPFSWQKVIEDNASATTMSSLKSSELKGFNYDEILQRAQMIFDEANTPGLFDRADQTKEFKDEAEELRWFMLPSEAADIVNKREVKYRNPDEFPFTPGRPTEELVTYQDNRKRWWILTVCALVVMALVIVVTMVIIQTTDNAGSEAPKALSSNETKQKILKQKISEGPLLNLKSLRNMNKNSTENKNNESPAKAFLSSSSHATSTQHTYMFTGNRTDPMSAESTALTSGYMTRIENSSVAYRSTSSPSSISTSNPSSISRSNPSATSISNPSPTSTSNPSPTSTSNPSPASTSNPSSTSDLSTIKTQD